MNKRKEELLNAGIEAIKEAKKKNVTLTQYVILGIVVKYEKCNISEIVKYSHLERTTVSKAIKVLIQKDLLKEEMSSSNKREKHITLAKPRRYYA